MPGEESSAENSTENSAERSRVATDEALARMVQRGDSDAFEQLVRRYVRPVHAVVASYLPVQADVEDAAQDTFLRVVRGIDAYDPDRPFAPWLYQIARNVARNRIAITARLATELLSPELQSALPGPDVILERAEIRARVYAALCRLPERRRTAFRLADVEGYATEEVARLMGLSEGTVRSHLHHARKALRGALAASLEHVENTGE